MTPIANSPRTFFAHMLVSAACRELGSQDLKLCRDFKAHALCVFDADPATYGAITIAEVEALFASSVGDPMARKYRALWSAIGDALAGYGPTN